MTHFKLMEMREVCNVYQPETISKKSLPANGKYPVYGANGKIGLNDKFNHKEPQLLLGCRGSVGSLHISEAFSWINGNAMVVQPFEDIVTRDYLKYALSGGISIKDAISGTAQPQITRESLSKIKIPVPSLEEQGEIVEKLDKVFAEIDLLEESLTSAEDKVTQLLKSILDSEYSLQGLKIEPLEKLVDILDNQRVPINATERSHRIGNVPYYGATGQVGTIDEAIFNETLILLGEDGVPFFDSTKHKAYEISGPSWVNNHAHVLRAKPDLVIQRYLLHFLNMFDYTGYVNGATRLKLTQGDMKRIPVPVPDIDVQKKIVAKVDSAFGEISKLNKHIALKREIAKELRQSILSCVFIREGVVA